MDRDLEYQKINRVGEEHEVDDNNVLLFTALVCTILLGLWLTGCGLFDGNEVTPPPTLPPQIITVVVSNTPVPETVEASDETGTPTATPSNTPEVAASPTNTPIPPTAAPTCGAPPGWIAYIVQPGNTLFRLATNTGTTVAAVKQANCLVGDTIFAGQILYLPSLPPTALPQPPTTQPSNDPTEEPPCTSNFCPNPELAGTLTLAPGGPNSATFVPCQAVVEPRLEFDTTTQIVQLGQRRYLYVCVNNPVSAILNRPDGQTQSLLLYSNIPNPDLQMGSASAIIDWPALPFEPTGLYSVTVTAGDGTLVDFLFGVEVPTEEKILVVPQAGSPGTAFQVYYVNFNMNSAATIELYGEDTPIIGGHHEMSQRSTWTVTIDRPLAGSPGKGWTQVALISQATDTPAAYAVTYDNKRIFDLFWLR